MDPDMRVPITQFADQAFEALRKIITVENPAADGSAPLSTREKDSIWRVWRGFKYMVEGRPTPDQPSEQQERYEKQQMFGTDAISFNDFEARGLLALGIEVPDMNKLSRRR